MDLWLDQEKILFKTSNSLSVSLTLRKNTGKEWDLSPKNMTIFQDVAVWLPSPII